LEKGIIVLAVLFHLLGGNQLVAQGCGPANKRVGVIGTGATGIQTITALSKEPSIKSLNVFQTHIEVLWPAGGVKRFALEQFNIWDGRERRSRQEPKDFDMRRDLANKRVGVIGTGATGIQTITALSKDQREV
jgi:cation diffusion facilitator CzcD-associated flavoprotein CzcO